MGWSLTRTPTSSRSQYRKAQLTAKHAASQAKLQERALLFSHLQSGTSTPLRPRKQNKPPNEDEVVTQASSDVTAALRRTHALLSSELARSRFAQQTLEQSSAALAELGERYADVNSLLKNSRSLVTTLLKSTKSDTWYLETTFYILITTIVWLVFRRWLYGPLTWFLVWPLKLLFRVFFGVLGLGASSTALNSSSALAKPSTTLIEKPSATGGIPRRNVDPSNPPSNHYVPVGGGGRGYRRDDPSAPGSVSQLVGRMAEQVQQAEQVQPTQEEGGEQQQAQQQQQGEEAVHPQLRTNRQQVEDEGPVVRGDGTVLKQRDKPRNPKKKMWDEGVEQQRMQRAQQEEQQGGEQGRKRDEL